MTHIVSMFTLLSPWQWYVKTEGRKYCYRLPPPFISPFLSLSIYVAHLTHLFCFWHSPCLSPLPIHLSRISLSCAICPPIPGVTNRWIQTYNRVIVENYNIWRERFIFNWHSFSSLSVWTCVCALSWEGLESRQRTVIFSAWRSNCIKVICQLTSLPTLLCVVMGKS